MDHIEMEQKAMEAFSDTRARMVSFKVPGVQKPAILFFASLILRLEPVIDWEQKTCATDGKKLHINPEWFLKLPANRRFTVAAHEAYHVAMMHHTRMGERELEGWNIAADLAVNPVLRESGFEIWDGAPMPGSVGPYRKFPAGLNAEAYYDLLQKQDGGGNGSEPQAQGGGSESSPSDGDDEKSGQSDESDGGGGSEGDQGSDSQPGDDGDGGGSGSGSCPDPGGCGGVMGQGGAKPKPGQDASGLGESEKSDEEGKVMVAVAQAANAAKSMGSLPGCLQRLVEEVMMPKQDWKHILREFITKQARSDHSYRRPNRRWMSQGLIMPSLKSEELGDVVVTVDCSGSIDQDTLNVFAGELQAIFEMFQCKVTILYHDIPVQAVQHWCPADGPLKLKPHGGGGTSHAPVFHHIENMDCEDAPIIVCFTDLYTSFPDKAPKLPVLWAVYGRYDKVDSSDVPFGQVVEIK